MVESNDFKVLISEDVRTAVNETVEYLGLEIYPIRKRMEEKNPLKVKEYIWQNVRKRDLLKLGKEILINEGYRFLYKVFGIEIVVNKTDITFSGVQLPSTTYSVTHLEYFDLDNMKHVSGIENIETEIYTEDYQGNIAKELNIKSSVLKIDRFKPGLLCEFSFSYRDDIDPWVVIEYSDRFLSCNVWGLLNDEDYPIWIENLIVSYSLFLAGNERLAFFVAFTALDEYIEIQYTKIVEIYNNPSKYGVDAIDYINNKTKIFSHEKEKRLIDEKLRGIFHEVVANYDKYGSLYEELRKYELMRNKIAHGEREYSTGCYIELLYDIIRVLYITGCGQDIDAIFDIECA